MPAVAERASTPPAPTIMEHFAADLERPENRYLRTPLVALITAGKLPKAALKDYAVLRWSFQAHANPAMMLSHASFLRGDAVEHLLENVYDEIFRPKGEGDHPGLWVQFALRLGATKEELVEVFQSAYFHTGALTLVHGMVALIDVLKELEDEKPAARAAKRAVRRPAKRRAGR